MIEIFHDKKRLDAHDLFQAWRRANLDGFFINCKGKTNRMLHRVTCSHPGDTEWSRDFGASLTKFKKACSAELKELLRWSKESGPVELAFCSDCLPVASVDTRLSLASQAQELLGGGYFDPQSVADARDRVLASIVRRQGQPSFRRHLLSAYGGRCVISGCMVEEVLDAAHIVPYQGRGTNHPANGLLMRTDLHTLFDLGLIAVDTATMRVLVSPILKRTMYEDYHGKTLHLPADQASHPSREALDQHRLASGLTKRKSRNLGGSAVRSGDLPAGKAGRTRRLIDR